MLVCDGLIMLVTGDPLAEIDAALATATRLRDQARTRGDEVAAQRLSVWIDQRLEERLGFRGHLSERGRCHEPEGPPHVHQHRNRTDR